MKIRLIILLLVGIVSAGSAQEQLGLKVSNYSGINGITLNPASGVGSRLQWDINVVSMGVFVENNYVYVRDANLFKVLRNTDNMLMATAIATEGSTLNPDALIVDFTQGNGRKFTNLNAFVMGPSAMFRVKQHTFGIYWGSRAVVSGQRVPGSLGYYDVDALEVGDQFEVGRFKVAGAFFSELGLNYGRNVLSRGKHQLDVGGTVKLLLGHDGFFMNNKERTTITVQDQYMTYDHANVRYGVANNVVGFGDAYNGYNMQVNGFGAAIDLGAEYRLYSNRHLKGYTWKFGASLLDVGRIAYTKNAVQHEVDTDSPFDFVQADYAGVQNFDNVYAVLSDQSLASSVASFGADRFGLALPMGLALQAERAITDHFLINATMVRRIRMPGAMVERSNILAITPRYELRWFEVSVPLVLLNDRDPRMGLALRLGPLVVGTDNLPSFFGRQNFSGTDVYLAIKINPVALRMKDKGNRGAPSKPNNCFYF